jgi:hypothetical protein
MPRILPSPFRTREWVLTFVALGSAVAALLLSNSAGLGAGGVLYLSVIIGTVFFVVIGGCHRVFLTALFTSALSAGAAGWSMVDCIFVRRESLSRDQLLLPLICLLMYVLIPVAFACLITFVVRQLERVFGRDDHVA